VRIVRDIPANALKTFADRLQSRAYDRIAIIDADTVWVDDPSRLLNYPGDLVRS
jgi:hypothetical protein